MKRIFTLSLLVISFFGLQAQNQPKGFHLDKPINMAAILAKKPSAAMGFSSVSEARSIINDIMEVVNIQQNFRVESTTQVDNAAAVLYQNTRYILYNPSFINELDNVAKDRWASISVLGHEIGHHLLGHTMDARGSQIPKELEADEFSGLVLRRLGASLHQAQLAMKLIASPYASATHPGENDRLAAIAKGWNSTIVQTNRGNTDVAIGTPDERRSKSPNTYPSPGSEKNYPVPSERRDNYPSNRRGNYPEDSRGNYPSGRRSDYPSTDEESNYPARNRRRNYPNSNDSRRDGRGNATSAQIVYDIRFNGNNGHQYYITSQNQVIMLRGNQGVVVAKIAATNKSNYPYVIYDDRQQIFVDRRGNLFTENGRSVGYITRHS